MFVEPVVHRGFLLGEGRRCGFSPSSFYQSDFWAINISRPTALDAMIVLHIDQSLSHIAEVITRGGIIAFRTDTFYGLGADPFNAAAVQKIRELKGREENKPILVLVSDPDQIDRLIERRSNAFTELAKRFWPGPLTIIGEARSVLPNELTAGTKTVGVRLPDDDRVRSLVRTCGGALTATSANPSGKSPARRAEDVTAYFGERVDLIIDGGTVKTDEPSTVVDATGTEVRVIREGVIAWSDIQSALHRLRIQSGVKPPHSK